MRALLNPIENPLQQYLTPQEQWQSEVNRIIRGGRKPANVPAIVSQRSERIPNFKYMLLDPEGFASYPIGGLNTGNEIYAGQIAQPSDYRLDNVNGLLMNCNLNFSYSDDGFDFFDPAPTPAGNYTMYFYVRFWLGAFDIGFLRAPFERVTMSLEFRLNYTIANNLFAFVESNRTFDILDTINPNAVNPEKVKSNLVSQFLETKTIQGQAGFDLGQVDSMVDTPNPVLSTANKNHFLYFWDTDVSSGFPIPDTYVKGRAFTFRPILTFNYSGTSAEFQPRS